MGLVAVFLSSFQLARVLLRWTSNNNTNQIQGRQLQYQQATTHDVEVTNVGMGRLKSSLDGMEIAIPPSKRFDNDTEGDEYFSRTARWYVDRPLPAIPQPMRQSEVPPPVPPKTIARKPVGSKPSWGLAGTRTARPSDATSSVGEKINRPNTSSSSSKPLPPSPRLSRRLSLSSPPSGHRPTQKAQQLMGCDVDIYDDTRQSGYLTERSSEYSQSDAGGYVLSSGSLPGNPRVSRLPTPPTGLHSRQTSFADSMRRGSQEQQRFSDGKAAIDYHKVAMELATDRWSGEHSHGTTDGASSSSLRFSGLSSQSRSPRSSNFPRPQHAPSIPEDMRYGSVSSVSQTPIPGERSGSAFESDSSDDEADAKIMDSLKGFVAVRTEKEISRNRRRSGQMQEGKRWLDKAKEWHWPKGEDKAERAARREEEQKKKWREQLRKHIEVKDGRRVL